MIITQIIGIKKINEKYGIIVDDHFWENNPVQSKSYNELAKSLKNAIEETLGVSGGAIDIHKQIGKLP